MRLSLGGDANQFVCPCHGSVFSIDGKVLCGPAPRPLDRYVAKVEDGKILIGSQVRSGLAEWAHVKNVLKWIDRAHRADLAPSIIFWTKRSRRRPDGIRCSAALRCSRSCCRWSRDS